MPGDVGIYFGGIEAGGTKFICGIGSAEGTLSHEISIPTTTPVETMQRVAEFFASTGKPLAAAGIGTFGPVQLDADASNFGYITSTPKPGWHDFDILGAVRRTLGVPTFIDTDVNAAALAETCWGAARGLKTFLYVTVGTGIGGGAMIDGQLLHGLLHPEMGHIRIPHDVQRDPFAGGCPYHGDCLEGLASGPAVEMRWGLAPAALPADHPAWALEAEYIAQACVNWICTLSPRRIILGGGMMQPHVFPLIRARVAGLMNGYLAAPELLDRIDQYIVAPGLGGRAGVLGALALASRAERSR